MNKRPSLTFTLVCLSLWLAGCNNTAMPIPTSAIQIPTSTPQVPTFTPSPIATLTATASATPQLLPISDEASDYLNEALDIMQTNSLYRESIDWATLRKDAFEVAKYAQTPVDTYKAIEIALARLGDRHSSFHTPDEFEQTVQLTSSDNPPPRGKLLLEKIGFIALPGYQGSDGDKYATNIQQLIREIDSQNPCGWIVDLRENDGGNMWPMLTGIGPILGEGDVGAFVDSYGHKEIWSYRDGQSLVDDHVNTQVNGQAYRLQASSPPVAVLTGVYTASSGEAIAIAFRERPNTRSFGQYTAGLSTANTPILLSNGALINITSAVNADRTGQTYGDEIYPDETVDDVNQFTLLMDEAIPQPAIDWLMRQPVCSGQK